VTSPTTPDPQAAVDFLRRVRPEGFWALARIDPDLPTGDPDKIRVRSFATREGNEARAWIERENAAGRNLYWTVNPLLRPVARKPSREDVAALEWLHVDVDPDKRKPLAEERARIEALVGDRWPAFLPRPTVLVDSGGGYQMLWRLAEPVDVGGRPEAYEEAARWNIQLEVVLGGDNCHNVDRLMRLPGTVNWPDAKKRAAGRAPAVARVAAADWDLSHPLSAFTPAAPRQGEGDATFPAPAPRRVETANVQRLLSLDELPETVPGGVKVVINRGHDPDHPRRWKSRSEPLFWVVCSLLRSGVSDDVVYSVITDPDFGISESVLDKGSRAERYALQQIQRAHEQEDDPLLADLNSRHAVVADVGGKCRVISESLDPVLGRDVFSLQTFEDMINRYSNRTVEVPGEEGDDPRTRDLGRWWLAHPQRRQYDRMLFAPGRAVPGAYNLWRGFACEAVPGDCSLYLDHVRRNICAGNEEHYEYLLSWMARAVQRPGDQAHVAIVLRGARGAGKGVFATNFGELFGRHFFPITSPSDVFGDFNEHLLDTVVLYADEAFFAGDKRNEAVLKGLITESRRVARAKFRAAETAANCLHIIMAANEDWVVPAGPHERRYLVLEVGNGNRQDKPHFRAIGEQLAAGGREALLHLLMTRDLSRFEPRDVPHTAAEQEQKEHSLPLEQEWWLEKLRAGQFREGEAWPQWIAWTEVLHDFTSHAGSWGRGHRIGVGRLWRMLERLGAERQQLARPAHVVVEDGETRIVDRPRILVLPTLEESRRRWAEYMGGEFSWTEGQLLQDRPREEAFS